VLIDVDVDTAVLGDGGMCAHIFAVVRNAA